MSDYLIEITDAAINDLNTIYYTLLNNKYYIKEGYRKYKSLLDAIESLTIFPYRNPIFKIEKEGNIEIRKMSVEKYLVLYTVYENVIVVLNVVFSASNIDSRLGIIS